MGGKHALRAIGLGGLALIGLGLWAAGPSLQAAQLGAGFAARQTCACVHLAERSLDACIADLPRELSSVRFVQDGQAVRASLLGGVVGARASFAEGYGCVLD